MIRALEAAAAEGLAAAWIDRLVGDGSPRIAASDLYSGDYWSVARSLSTLEGAEVWICSAGYGLVGWDAQLRSYAATFSPGQPDSVARQLTGPPTQARRSWWRALSGWEGPSPGAPRTVAELAARQPDSPILVAASTGYLDALAEDLIRTASGLNDPEDLSIISAGTRDLPGLSRHLVPCDARFQPIVGGSLNSLNARIARHLLSSTPRLRPRATELRGWARGMLGDSPRRASPARDRMSDEEVLRLISEELGRDPTAGCNKLLRRLREGGRACEQSRFTGLYSLARGMANGDFR
jgi:hypothetical protein